MLTAYCLKIYHLHFTLNELQKALCRDDNQLIVFISKVQVGTLNYEKSILTHFSSIDIALRSNGLVGQIQCVIPVLEINL